MPWGVYNRFTTPWVFLMSENTNKLPLMEIIFLTSIVPEQIEENLPVLKVVQNKENYIIVEGSELIDDALAQSFRQINRESQLSLVFAVNLIDIRNSSIER